MDAIKKLLDNEKGIVAVMLILGATAFVLTGKMTIAEWQSFAVWVFGAYAGSTALHEAAIAIGGSKPTNTVLQAIETVVAGLAKPAAPVAAPSPSSSQAGRVRMPLVMALGLVTVLIAGSCAWWQKSGKTAVVAGGKAAAACVVGDVESYSGEVLKDLASDGFEQGLATFGKEHNFTQDAVNCIVATVLAVVAAAMPAHSEPTPVILHARAYLAAHGAAQ